MSHLQRRADALGREWAAADPVDARQLLPALLMGAPDMAERVDAAYVDAIRASMDDPMVED